MVRTSFDILSILQSINQIFHYTCCITPKRVTTLWGFTLRHPDNTAAFEEMLQRWRAVATLFSI